MSDEVAEEIMAATYRALCEHGYANLTMQDIADETDKSKAALHYHYESKRDLLLAFLDYLYEEFTGQVDEPVGDTPAERLQAFIELILTPPTDEERTREAFGTAMLELKAQAPYDTEIRNRLQKFDEFLTGQIREYLEAGIEQGEFRNVDPDDVARFIVTSMDGARTEQVAVGRDLACTRRVLQTYVDASLTVDEDGHSERTDRGRQR